MTARFLHEPLHRIIGLRVKKGRRYPHVSEIPLQNWAGLLGADFFGMCHFNFLSAPKRYLV